MAYRKRNQKIDLAKYKEDSKKGVKLEDNLEYPQKLHDLHKEFPLAPEKMKVTKEMLSSYCGISKRKFNIGIGQVHKLIPTLKIRKKSMCYIIEMYRTPI